MSAHLSALAGLLLSSVLASAAAPPRLSSSQVQQQLLTPVRVCCEGTPLRQVLDDVSDSTGVKIVADLPALQQANISLDLPVTVKIDQVSLKSTLRLMLRAYHLAYFVKDEVVVVTTEEAARGQLRAASYPVRDLLSQGVVENRERLVDLITDIESTTWAKLGGMGTIDYHPMTKSLVINQTADVHEQVADLLQALRRLGERKKSD
jgi:type II secretory pathway component GspD/PulD (secretin)